MIAIRILDQSPELDEKNPWISYARKNGIHVLHLVEPLPAGVEWILECCLDTYLFIDHLLSMVKTADKITIFEGPNRLRLRSNLGAATVPDSPRFEKQGEQEKAKSHVIAWYNVSLQDQQMIHSFTVPQDVSPRPLSSNNHTTLVTAFWPVGKDDLTSRMERMHAVLSLNQRMVIWCDPTMVETFQAIRNSYGLRIDTVVYGQRLDEFEVYKHLPQVEGKFAHHQDFHPRQTPMRLILDLARIEALAATAVRDPFGTSTFAWINICSGKLGLKSMQQVQRALQRQFCGISIMMVDYVPKSLMSSASYYKQLRCGFADQIFKGTKAAVQRLNTRLQHFFHQVLAEGYRPSMDHLWWLVFHDGPNRFDCYFGDFPQVVLNHDGIRDGAVSVIYSTIQHSAEERDYTICREACDAVFSSWALGRFSLNPAQFWWFLQWYFITAWYQSDEPLLERIMQVLAEQMQLWPEFGAHLQTVEAEVYRVTDYYLLKQSYKTVRQTKEAAATPDPSCKLFIWREGPLTAQSLIHQNPVVRSEKYRTSIAKFED